MLRRDIKEFKVVSTGTDVAAQLGAIEDFINQGYDAIIVNAVSPEGFDRIIRLADKNNVVLVPFDNALDTDKVMQVNEDQTEMGRMSAKWLLDENRQEIRRHPRSARPTRQLGRPRPPCRLPGGDEGRRQVQHHRSRRQLGLGTSQKVTADALAVHGHFDGVFTQGGSDGTVRAMMDAHHPFVPMAGEGENEFRKQIAEHAKDGLKGLSYGQSPALVAISIKAAIAALKGEVMPQLISIPIPVATYKDLKPGVNSLAGPQRQLLRAEPVRALRRQLHGAADHGAERVRTRNSASSLDDRWPGAMRRATSPAFRKTCIHARHGRFAGPELPCPDRHLEALWRRGGARWRRLRAAHPAASTRCSARTARANRR